jgi:cytochrome c-type biogenesis protein
MFAESVSIPAAFAAGLLSFFAPCVLPLIPAYFTFISGFSLEEMTQNPSANVRRRLFVSTLAYVLGFSMVFVLLGATASALGGLVFQYSDWIRIIGGIFIVIFGLHLTGILKFNFLNVDRHIHVRQRPWHLLGTFMVGMAFGAGWSPCVGPLLGSILILASSQESVLRGVGLLAVFSAGLALPFVVLSIFINYLLGFLNRFRRVIKYANMTAGLLMLIIGIALITNQINFIS